jgi:transposase
MKNKYINRSRISEAKFREILRLFCADLTSTSVGELTGISRVTTNKIFNQIRVRILEYQNNLNSSIQFSGDVELDESYFGARRVRGKRGRGARGKDIVFGILKRDGCVYLEIIDKVSKQALMPIIKGKILQEQSTVYTDGWKSYDGLITSGFKHYRIYHSHNEFARGKNHINGIESFWSYCKRRLNKFNGSRTNFLLHLKESEFRFNNRQNNIYQLLLKLIRNNPI